MKNPQISKKQQLASTFNKNDDINHPELTDSPISLRSLTRMKGSSPGRSGEKCTRVTHISIKDSRKIRNTQKALIFKDKHDFAWKTKSVYLVKLKRSLRLRAEPELYLNLNNSFSKSARYLRDHEDSIIDKPANLDTKNKALTDTKDVLANYAKYIPQELEPACKLCKEAMYGYPCPRIEADSDILGNLETNSMTSHTTNNSFLGHQQFKSALRNSPKSTKGTQKQVSFKEPPVYSNQTISDLDESKELNAKNNPAFLEKLSQKHLQEYISHKRSYEQPDPSTLFPPASSPPPNHPHTQVDGTHTHTHDRKYRMAKSMAKAYVCRADAVDHCNDNDGMPCKADNDKIDKWWFDDGFLNMARELVNRRNDENGKKFESSGKNTGLNSAQIFHSAVDNVAMILEALSDEKNAFNDAVKTTSHNQASSRIPLYSFSMAINSKKRPKRLPPPPIADAPQTPLPAPSIIDDLTDCRSQITRLLNNQHDQNSIFCLSKDDNRSAGKDFDTKTEMWLSPETCKNSAKGARSTAGRIALTGNFIQNKVNGLKTSTRKNSDRHVDIDKFDIEDESPEDFNMTSINNSEEITCKSHFKKTYLNKLNLNPIDMKMSEVALKRKNIDVVEVKDTDNHDSADYFDTFRLLGQNNEINSLNKHSSGGAARFSCRDVLKKTISQTEDRYMDSPDVNHSERAGYTNRSDILKTGASVRPKMNINDQKINFEMMDASMSPRSINSSSITPLNHLERGLHSRTNHKGKPSLYLNILADKIDEIDSREVSPKNRIGNKPPSKISEPVLNLETTSFSIFMPGKQTNEAKSQADRSHKSAFDHHKLTSLINTQLQGLEEVGNEAVNNKISLITNQIVNIFDKMHRLGDDDDFESVVHSVEQKHTEESASVRNIDLTPQVSGSESVKIPSSLPRTPKSTGSSFRNPSKQK